MNASLVGLSAAEQQGLYVMLTAWSLIFLGVLGVMLRSISRHRRSMPERPFGIDGGTGSEIAWTAALLVLVVLVAGLSLT